MFQAMSRTRARLRLTCAIALKLQRRSSPGGQADLEMPGATRGAIDEFQFAASRASSLPERIAG